MSFPVSSRVGPEPRTSQLFSSVQIKRGRKKLLLKIWFTLNGESGSKSCVDEKVTGKGSSVNGMKSNKCFILSVTEHCNNKTLT